MINVIDNGETPIFTINKSVICYLSDSYVLIGLKPAQNKRNQVNNILLQILIFHSPAVKLKILFCTLFPGKMLFHCIPDKFIKVSLSVRVCF
jgi:hypothetical protein